MHVQRQCAVVAMSIARFDYAAAQVSVTSPFVWRCRVAGARHPALTMLNVYQIYLIGRFSARQRFRVVLVARHADNDQLASVAVHSENHKRQAVGRQR